MKIVATSDLHGEMPELPECDLLIIAGDVCPIKGSHEPAVQRSWLRHEFFPYLDTLPAKNIVWIGGNHDFVCEQPGFYRIADEAPDHVTYLQDTITVVDVDGERLSVYGSPWTPNLPTWAFFKDTPGFQALAETMPPADIYVLHSPPSPILCGGHSEWGSPFVAGAINRNMPKQVVFGHIHEGYGREVHGDIVFRNVAYLDELYDVERKRFPQVWHMEGHE